MQAKKNNLLAIIFAIPFAAIAVMTGTGLYKEYEKVPADYTLVLFLSFMTSLFGGLSITAIVGVIWSLLLPPSASSSALLNQNAEKKEEERLSRKFGGTIYNSSTNKTLVTSGNASIMYGLWVAAVFLLPVIIAPGIFLERDLNSGRNIPYLLFAIPLAYLVILIFALRATVRWKKFGQTTVEYEGKEVSFGQTFKAFIKTSKDVVPVGDIFIELKALQTKTTGSGSNRNKETTKIASVKEKISNRGVKLRHGIPFSLVIPQDFIGKEQIDGYEDIRLILAVMAKTNGIDYAAEFILPIENQAREIKDLSEQELADELEEEKEE